MDGAIGLANITVLSGTCRLNGESDICDFESGNCNWTANALGSANYKFKWMRAGTSSWGVTSSEYDHTTDSDEGHYMEVSGSTYNTNN